MSERRGRTQSEEVTALRQEVTRLRQEIAALPPAVGAELVEGLKPVEQLGTTLAPPMQVAQALAAKLDRASAQLSELDRQLQDKLTIPEPTLLGVTRREWNAVGAGIPVGVILTMALVGVMLTWVR